MKPQYRARCTRAIGLLLLAASAATPAAVASSKNGIDAVRYTAHLEPDLAAQTLRGRVTLDLRMTAAGQSEIVLDRGELVVETVREAGQELSFREEGKSLLITLARPARAGERHQIEIRYHGAPRYGLEFQPERSQLYTIFSTSQWLPAVDAPSDRATLALDVVLPAGLKAIGNGRALRVQRVDGDRELHRWRQDVPVPSYTFGFAAGRFTQVDTRGHGTELTYLGDGFTEDELRRVFAHSGDMLDWFAQRAGVPYPGKRYSQALVAETIGQEHAGFSLMSEAHGRHVLSEPQDQALIAHEAAHQWWGNGVTCADWTHFWLNEGFANFMTAAYLQHRFGAEAYDKQVNGWRKRIERLRVEGKDRPLVYPDWNQPSGDDRAVVYQKGAYVLHLLREQLGEQVFWRGIREYTRANFGRAVVTSDFQSAMERAASRPLTPFFQQWVYAVPRETMSQSESSRK